MAKRKKSKISKKRNKDVPVIENLVAKYAKEFNICKVIDTNDKKYKRKQKHKEVYSGVILVQSVEPRPVTAKTRDRNPYVTPEYIF